MSENTNDEPEIHRADIAWLRKDNIAWTISFFVSCIAVAIAYGLLIEFIVRALVGETSERPGQGLPGFIGDLLILGPFFIVVFFARVKAKVWLQEKPSVPNKDFLMGIVWVISAAYISKSLLTKASMLLSFNVYVSGIEFKLPIFVPVSFFIFLYLFLYHRNFKRPTLEI